MAQSGGYPNNVPPISGSGNSAPGYVINGQPPQWGRPPLASMKPSKPPFNQYSSQSNPASSNGTPTRPHFSNPGSVSSHSSRDPSPIPSNCSDGMTHSQENVVNPNLQLRHSPQQRINTGVPANSIHLPNSRQMPQQAFVQSKTISNQSGGDSGVNSSPPVPKQFKDGIDVSATISGPRMSTHVSNSQFSQKNSVSPSKIFSGGQNSSLPEATPRHSDQLGRLNQTAVSSDASQNVAMNRLYPANTGGQSSVPSQMYSPPVITSQHSSGIHSSGGGGGGGAGDLAGPRQANPSTALRSDSSSLPPNVSQQYSHGTVNSRMQGGPEVFSNQVNSNQYMAHPQHPMTSSSGAFPPQVGNYTTGQHQPVSFAYTSGASQSQQQPQFSASNVISSGISTSNTPAAVSSKSIPSHTPAVSSKSIPSPAYFKPPTSVPYNPFDQTAKPNSSVPYSQASYSSVNQGVRYPHPPSTASQQFGKPTSTAQVSNQMPPPPVVSQNQQFQQVINPYSYQSGSMGYPPQGPTQNQYQSGPMQPEAQYVQKRYPQQSAYPSQAADGLVSPMANLSVTQQGFNKLWGLDFYDLLQTRNILPPDKVEPPVVKLHQEFLDSVNCSPEIFRCTLTKIPESNSLLQKSRLPLGILIHPFKDLNHLPVIQCSTIVRCRVCRTYIHPFVHFVDHKHWKCNLCFRVNELPEEFQYDPVSKTYGDPSRRPEVKSSTIEFIAPSEYMLRPPQPAVYLFVLDVSQLAVESGYLQIFCDILLDELDRLPGDGRTQIGFITFDSNVHFYNLAEGLSQPQQMIVVDTDDVFLPCPDNLLVNLGESRELVGDLLRQLPQQFQSSFDNRSALGAALQASYKLMAPTGGRISVFQSCLPTVGPGSLTPREDPNQRSGKDAPHLNPATDFYKLLALDCSGQQVAVDLFLINSQYCDVATISGVSRFSGGCIYHFPLFKSSNILQAEKFERTLRRYLSRKIGFEAVMRIRCSRGLAIHTFHGNFFVRSTDLLSLPNVNPDAGFGMQVSIEENLSEVQNVCFQAALLYTTSKGERRIRVHTLCLPVATTLPDILQAADQQCIVGLLAKMAVDRSHQSSLSDARDAFINVAIDVLSAYRVVQPSGPSGALMAPHNLRLLPLYILALLKYVAFRTGQSTRLDDRLFAMCQMKTLPLGALIQTIYPDLYPVHALEDQLTTLEDGSVVPQPPRLHLSAEKLEHRGAFLLDIGDHMMIYVGHNAPAEFYSDVLGVSSFAHIPDEMYELPVLETDKSENMTNFINRLQAERPFCATLEIIRDDSPRRVKFTERLIEDRTESALSYYEFLQHLKANVK